MNSANGYFSPKGIPYHSVETLIVEAPDYGHETTSETYSYWLWLTADLRPGHRRLDAFNNAWAVTMQIHDPERGQPARVAAPTTRPSPATYGPDGRTPQLPGGAQLLGPGRL